MKAFKLNTAIMNGKGAFLSMLMVTLLLFIAGCSNNPVTTTSTGTGNTDDNISLSLQSQDGVTDNAAIVITEAKGLLTEIEVESDSSSRHIQAGPIVVQMNVAGLNQVMTSGVIPNGIYKKIKFQLHKPEDNETISDPEFREGSSGNQRYSFIIKGTYNGTPFIFKSRKTINIVMSLTSPLNLNGSRSNLTILFDKLRWFNSGALNPNNDDDRDEIDDNIRDSFKRVFRDNNRDGIPDDSQ